MTVIVNNIIEMMSFSLAFVSDEIEFSTAVAINFSTTWYWFWCNLLILRRTERNFCWFCPKFNYESNGFVFCVKNNEHRSSIAIGHFVKERALNIKRRYSTADCESMKLFCENFYSKQFKSNKNETMKMLSIGKSFIFICVRDCLKSWWKLDKIRLPSNG